MSSRELALRQQLLLTKSAELRVQIGGHFESLGPPLAVFNYVETGLRWVAGHPQWPLAALLVFLWMKPRTAWVCIQRGWWGWETYTKLKAFLVQRDSGIGFAPSNPIPRVSSQKYFM